MKLNAFFTGVRRNGTPQREKGCASGPGGAEYSGLGGTANQEMAGEAG
jgi:hypothetical protein